MKTCPKKDLRKKEFPKELVVSKLPVYTLHLFNWIPPMSLKEKKMLFVVYVVFTTIIHVLGITFISLSIYGIVSSKYAPIIPMPMKHVLLGHPMYLLINAGSFMYRSFCTYDTRNILKVTDERISNRWSTTHKSFMAFLFGFYAMFSVARQHAFYNNVYKDYFRKILIYQYIENQILIDILFTGYYLYTAYLMTFQHLFPLFITYMSICFCTNINSLQQYLEEIKNDAENPNKQFKTFTQKLNETIYYLKTMDEAYRNNIGFFIVMSIIDFINWLYTYIVFHKCYRYDKITITAEMLGFLILFIMVSNIHSKVSYTYSNFKS